MPGRFRHGDPTKPDTCPLLWLRRSTEVEATDERRALDRSNSLQVDPSAGNQIPADVAVTQRNGAIGKRRSLEAPRFSRGFAMVMRDGVHRRSHLHVEIQPDGSNPAGKAMFWIDQIERALLLRSGGGEQFNGQAVRRRAVVERVCGNLGRRGRRALRECHSTQ